jgi:adenylate cyclase
MGSDLRFQYTVMGDSVNLASRLEGQTKVYGLSIIIGSRTAVAIASEFALLEMDLIRVKGKTEPEVIYTILGRADIAQTAEFKALQHSWENVLVSYRKQDWSGALQSLQLSLGSCEKFGLLGLADRYADRIRRLEQSPPDPDWGGVYSAEVK